VHHVRQASFHTGSEEVDFPSKRTGADAANGRPQNSSEEPGSKTIKITGGPETAREEQRRPQFAEQKCAQILEDGNFLSRIVFSDEGKVSHLWACQSA
jgi:hypothetical protein